TAPLSSIVRPKSGASTKASAPLKPKVTVTVITNGAVPTLSSKAKKSIDLTFSAPPDCYIPRPRLPLPESTESLSTHKHPYESHPSYTMSREMCSQYRSKLDESKRVKEETARIRAWMQQHKHQTSI